MKILALSNEWVILIVSTMRDVVVEINRLSGGKYQPLVDKWEASAGQPHRDWQSRNLMTPIRDEHIAMARENVGEHLLSEPQTFTPTPLQVGRVLVGIDKGITPGGTDTEYVHYCYLRVPPMEEGCEYTFACRGETATLLYDRHTVSRAIKVNQVGYLPDAPKFAYIGAHIYGVGPMETEAETFDVRRMVDDAVVFTGPVILRDANTILPDGRPLTGENVYSMEFTELADYGEFYIHVPGVGCSWPFRHAPDAYGEAFYTTMRGLFHHRCGQTLRHQNTPYAHPKCHTRMVGESQLIARPISGDFGALKQIPFDVNNATGNTSTVRSVIGGWHDAADADKRNYHYTAIWDLLYAYELAPQKFSDAQLNITESGDGIPDILNEAAWGLKVWASSMNADGGVSGYCETVGHPPVWYEAQYYFSRRTRWDSLNFAAAAAMLAQHLRRINLGAAKQWEWYALKAYQFGNNPANSLGRTETKARSDKGVEYSTTWTELDSYIEPYLIHARTRLYMLTGNKAYLSGVKDMFARQKLPFRWPYGIKDYSGWMIYPIAKGDDPNLKALRPDTYVQEKILQWVDKYVMSPLQDTPYRCSYPKQPSYMGWGLSNTMNYGRILLTAYHLTGNEKYRDAAILNCDFMLGSNAMGMSWTTGLGSAYPINIQNEVSMNDGVADPIPGITIYGPTGGSYWRFRENVMRSPSPVGPIDFLVPVLPHWRGWSCHPTANVGQCEYTIHETMSAAAFCSAMLLPDTPWKPRPITNPRPVDELHGLYYLP